jgi:hypothetical protein
MSRASGFVETPILIIRVTFPDVTSAYYFLLYFPYYVGSLLSQIYLNISFLFSFFFSYLNGFRLNLSYLEKTMISSLV